jgi:hypothetical protein
VAFLSLRPWLVSSGSTSSSGCPSADSVVVAVRLSVVSSPGIQPQLVNDDDVVAAEDEDVGQDEFVVVADVGILYLPQDRKFTSCLLWSPQDRRGAGQDHPQGPRGSLVPRVAAPTGFDPSSFWSCPSPGMLSSLPGSCLSSSPG